MFLSTTTLHKLEYILKNFMYSDTTYIVMYMSKYLSIIL